MSSRHSSSDCVQCQRTTRGANEKQVWNIGALQSMAESASWSINEENNWEPLLDVLKQSGFLSSAGSGSAKRGDGEYRCSTDACPILPSRVTIVAAAAVRISLKSTNILCDTGDSDASLEQHSIWSERILLTLQFVAWLSTNPENRRVLIHHGITACICNTLVAIRELGVDVLSSSAESTAGWAQDGLFAADIRSFDWQKPLLRRSEASINTHRARGRDARQSAVQGSIREAVSVTAGLLFQNTMHLCVCLLDPDRQFIDYLRGSGAIEPIADLSVVDTQDSLEGVLKGLLRFWRYLGTAPSRTQFSSAVLSLCCATGGLLVSGCLDGQLVSQLRVVEAIGRTLTWLDVDEAYVAWRLMLLAVEQHPEVAGWSSEIQDGVNAFWATTASRPAEYLRSYEPVQRVHRPDTAIAAALSAEDKRSLDTIYFGQVPDSFDSDLTAMRRSIKTGPRSSKGQLGLATFDLYLTRDGCSIPDTRLRRIFDAVVAHVSQHSAHPSLPWFVQSSLTTAHQLFIAIASHASVSPGTAPSAKHLSPEPGAFGGSVGDLCSDSHAKYMFLAEYTRFLWKACLLPLQPAALRTILDGVRAQVWDRLLSCDSVGICLSVADSEQKQGEGSAMCVLQRMFTLAGWLLTRSLPSSTAPSSGLLKPPVCKLVFTKLLEVISALSVRGSESAAYAAGFYAAQSLLVVCWENIQRFRSLVHETQSLGCLVTAVYNLNRAVGQRGGGSGGGSHAVDAIAQSIGDLSVVSLPEESSVWDIADPAASTKSTTWADRLMCAALFLLEAAAADCSQERTSEDAGWTGFSVHEEASQSLIPRVVWQLCHSSACRQENSKDLVSYSSVLRDLSSSNVWAIVEFSSIQTTAVLRWLLIAAFGNEANLGVEADSRERIIAAQRWSSFALQCLVPSDISEVAPVRQHARFAELYRGALLHAMSMLAYTGAHRDVGSLIVSGGALEDLLSMLQLAATINLSGKPTGDSTFSSFNGGNTHGSSHASEYGRNLGVLIGEALALIALLIHGSPEHTSTFAGFGGYRITHTCTETLMQHPAIARAPIAEGLLSLLSGSPCPSACRTWGALLIDRDWVSTVVAAYPHLVLEERIPVMRFIARWCEANSRAQWWWSQSTMARQCVEGLQLLFLELSLASPKCESRKRIAVAYIRALGRMLAAVLSKSVCASDLKLVFRTLASGPGDPRDQGVAFGMNEAAGYTTMVRQMLSAVLMKCARSEAGGSYFSFGGQPSAIHAPFFRRIPEKGFTFAAWLHPDQIVAPSSEQHVVAPAKEHSALSSLSGSEPSSRNLSTSGLPSLFGGDAEPKPTSGTILCLTAAQGDMLVISHNFISQGIEIQLTIGGSSQHVKCAEGRVGPRRWHSLSVCYTPAKRGWSPFGSSNVHVYLNGMQAYKGSLPFIEQCSYRSCYIGGSPAFLGRTESSARQRNVPDIARSFSGRISGIRMFDGPLRSHEVELLHHLGPTHSMQFRKPQGVDPMLETLALSQTPSEPPAASRSASLSDDINALFQGGDLSARLILSLDAGATSDRTCYDLSPIGVCQTVVRENLRYSSGMAAAQNLGQNTISLGPLSSPKAAWETAEAKARLEEAAQPWQMRGDVLPISTMTIHQALHFIGGLEPALILLHHLDWIGSAAVPAKEGPLGSEESVFDQKAFDRMPLPSFFYWLRDIIRGDPRHLTGIRTLQLVPLIASILQKSMEDPASHLTIAALRAMQAFQSAFDEQGGLLPAVYSDTSLFWSQVQHDLVLNLSIWRRAGTDNQLQYLKEAHRILCAGRRGDRSGKRSNASAGICGPSAGSGAIGIRWILYSLFNFYPYDSSQHIQHQQQQQQKAKAAARQPPTRTTVLINEANAHSEGSTPSGSSPPVDIASDRGSISNESCNTVSDDGYGHNDDDDEYTSGEIPGFPALPRSETRQMRRILLRTLELFLSASEDHSSLSTRHSHVPDANKADISHLIRHLLYTCNRDTDHTKEILQLLFRCLADGSHNANGLASKLLSLHGLSVVCHIIECDDDIMAAEAINIIVLFSTMASAAKEYESAASRLTNSFRGRASVAIESDDVSRALALVRTKQALTPALYRSLLCLALRDHASLLASANISSAARGHLDGMPGKRAPQHVRNLSAALSAKDDVAVLEAATTDGQESFVSPLPSRLIQTADACNAILELACAPGTDPAIRVMVINDLHRLLNDEPRNYDALCSSQLSVLNMLVTMVVLAGYLTSEASIAAHCAASSPNVDAVPRKGAAQPYRLAEVYVKAVDHLELIPHTTLDQHLQSLAIGHAAARKAWVERRASQLRNTMDKQPLEGTGRAYGSHFDRDINSLSVQAEAELMASAADWSQATVDLIRVLVWNLFRRRPDCADEVHRSILRLWAYTPTGSVPLALRLMSAVLSQAQSEFSPTTTAAAAGAVQDDNSVLLQNLAAFVLHALDFLFNYHQFQEYVAFHHEKLKALSTSPSATAPSNPASDRDTIYRSQHSPWDDTPELTREMVRFMLQIDEHRAGLKAPMCEQILRLILSGVRSMQLQRVEESLAFMVQLLERHPFLGAGPGLPSTDASGFVCDGACGISQQALAALGYIHEAYMFAEEQAEAADPPHAASTPDAAPQSSEPLPSKDGAGQASVRGSIAELYMLVFQRFRAHLEETCLRVFLGSNLKKNKSAYRFDQDRKQFIQFIQSPEWQDLYRTRFMPSMRSMEEVEMRQASASQDAFACILSEVLVHSYKDESSQMRAVKDVQTAVAGSTLPVEAEETSRVKADAAEGPCWIPGGQHGPWLRLWRRRLRELSGPRGPWRVRPRSSRRSNTPRHHWMLDATENSSRMRRRLIKNAHFEDHHLAASRRDRTGSQRKPSAQNRAGSGSGFDGDEDVPQLSLSISGIADPDAQGPEGDEEWSLVTSEDLTVVAAAEPGRVLLGVAGERIVLLGGVCGRVELTKSSLRFAVGRDKDGRACFKGSDSSSSGSKAKSQSSSSRSAGSDSTPQLIRTELGRDISWPLSQIHQIHFRRYMLRKSALEIFFADHTSVFLNIPDKKDLLQLMWKITSLSAANSGLSLSDIKSPPGLLSRLKLTERWQHGELSNFDYLMALNTVAGRSYNDLSQYPVFPWIISDYTSKWLDLQDPRVYRDLSRPIGALNERRLRHFVERYETFEDPTGRIKKFHYGTHYSSAASVAYYLIRTEPFTSVHISLQSGKFDHADRQFHSISDAWNSCMTGPGDVKELVPEFFYLPEFLVNLSSVDLGKKQDGTRLGDVKLPPWASTPEEFVRINRQALESDYVSANLHRWIDLIFGYKQRGPEAVKSHNVFYYLTYEGAVNLDSIQDPIERASVESQINYFGQTPTQLFTAPHPARHAHLPPPLYTPLTSPTGQVQHFVLQASNCDISFISSPQRTPPGQQPMPALGSMPWPDARTRQSSQAATAAASVASSMGAAALGSHSHRAAKETITAVDSSGRVSVYQLSLFTSHDYKFQLAVEPLVEGYYMLSAASPPSDSQRFAVAHQRPVSYATIPNMPELLVSCAHHDGTVKCTRIAGERPPAPDTPQRAALVSAMVPTSRSISMTNAYAGAVVGAMSRPPHRNRASPAASKPASAPAGRGFGGLFGGSLLGGSDSDKQASGSDAGVAESDPTGMSAPPSVFIPLAARLLDTMNASSYVYLPGQQTCVSVSDDGGSVAIGSSQGTVSVLSVDFGAGAGSGSMIFGADGGQMGAGAIGAAAPLMFASGLADPMNTDIGYTSMAAYTSGGGSSGARAAGTKGGKWMLNHVLHGHDAAVLDVAISTDHDTIASASADGTVILWTRRAGQYLRTLAPASPDSTCSDDIVPSVSRHQEGYSRVERVLLSAEALVVCYSVSGSLNSTDYCDRLDPVRSLNQSSRVMPQKPQEFSRADSTSTTGASSSAGSQGMYESSQQSSASAPQSRQTEHGEGASEVAALHVYNINGRHLRTRKLVRHLRDIALTRDGRFGACVSLDSRVAVFDTHTLGIVRQFELPACGCSVAWSGVTEQQLVVGCEGGRIVVISADLSYLH